MDAVKHVTSFHLSKEIGKTMGIRYLCVYIYICIYIYVYIYMGYNGMKPTISWRQTGLYKQ